MKRRFSLRHKVHTFRNFDTNGLSLASGAAPRRMRAAQFRGHCSSAEGPQKYEDQKDGVCTVKVTFRLNSPFVTSRTTETFRPQKPISFGVYDTLFDSHSERQSAETRTVSVCCC